MPKAIIFDIDGTLIDSVDAHARAWQDALRDYGKNVAFDDIRGQIGKGGDQLMPVFLSPAEMAAKGDEIEKHRSAIFKRDYLGSIKAFPQVRTLFQHAKSKGTIIVLASSAKKDELKIYKQIAEIEDLVTYETSSNDVERSKPYPDIFESALAMLDGIDKSEVIVVGDTPYDAEAAGKAGLRTIGVLCGGFPEETLRAAGCIAIYEDPAGLLYGFDNSPLGDRPL